MGKQRSTSVSQLRKISTDPVLLAAILQLCHYLETFGLLLVNRKNTRAWRDELRLFAQLVFNQCEKIKGLAPQRAEIVNGADQIQEGLELLNAEWDQLTVKKAWLVSQALIHGKKQILLARRQLRD